MEEILQQIDLWLIGIGGLLTALYGIAKITKTEKDDRIIGKILSSFNSVRNLLRPTAVKETESKSEKKSK